MPPISKPNPTTPLSTIMNTAYMVSRASVALPVEPSMAAEISATSITTMESVSTSVPSGSPNMSASVSASCTTPKATHTIVRNSHANSASITAGWALPSIHDAPKIRNNTTVSQPAQGRAVVRDVCMLCLDQSSVLIWILQNGSASTDVSVIWICPRS